MEAGLPSGTQVVIRRIGHHPGLAEFEGLKRQVSPVWREKDEEERSVVSGKLWTQMGRKGTWSGKQKQANGGQDSTQGLSWHIHLHTYRSQHYLDFV